MTFDLRELGFVGKFKNLREEQEYALRRLLSSPARLDVTALPTGVGKSLLAVLDAKLTELPTVILTSTKGLQDQYIRDFPELVDVRGMGNWPCRELENRMACDLGPCMDGVRCTWKDAGCIYHDRVRKARRSKLVITNYAFWFQHRDDQVLGKRELVIMDEAHALPQELAGAVGVEFRPKEVEWPAEAVDWGLEEWRVWALEKLLMVGKAMGRPGLTTFDRRKLRRLGERLARLQAPVDFAFDVVPEKLVRFEPVDLKPYVEPYLLQGASRAVMMSATIRPAHLEDLGLTANYTETASPFPVEHRPIIWTEVGVRLSAKSSEGELQKWLTKIDELVESRLDRKGIIHAVSYHRANYIRRNSRFRKHMIVHEPDAARRTVEQFKRMEPPAILVSPVVHTGYDFPYDEAAWQIIGKMPFPDCRFGIAKARTELDETWPMRFAASTLVQMAGRVVRAEDDLGETLITDDNVKWLMSRYRPYFPRWFRDAFRAVVEAPLPWWKGR